MELSKEIIKELERELPDGHTLILERRGGQIFARLIMGPGERGIRPFAPIRLLDLPLCIRVSVVRRQVGDPVNLAEFIFTEPLWFQGLIVTGGGNDVESSGT